MCMSICMCVYVMCMCTHEAATRDLGKSREEAREIIESENENIQFYSISECVMCHLQCVLEA